MEFFLASIGGAALIFILRVGDMSLDTVRVLFVMRGRKGLAWVLGFFQSLIFVIAISSVLSNLNNIYNVIGYASGFATGNVVGMLIEERLALGHIHFTIISSMRGAAVTAALREGGFAVTEVAGRGKDGTVTMLHCDVFRRDISRVEKLVFDVDSSAFVTAEDMRTVTRGFWRA